MKLKPDNPKIPEMTQESKFTVKDDTQYSPIPELQAFAKNVWIVEGPNVRNMGVMFTTRMMVVKLTDGSILVNSPVPVPFETLKQICELGPVKYLVAATPRHIWRLESWHTLFPGAQLWAPRPTPFTLNRAHLPLTGILSDTTNPGWADDFDQLAFKGSPFIKEVLFYHKVSHTVVLDDLIQNNLEMKGRPIRNALFKLEGAAYPNGGVGFDIKITFTNRNLARQSLKKLLSWDFDKLIIAHGPCIEKDAKPFVERAFRWLAP